MNSKILKVLFFLLSCFCISLNAMAGEYTKSGIIYTINPGDSCHISVGSPSLSCNFLTYTPVETNVIQVTDEVSASINGQRVLRGSITIHNNDHLYIKTGGKIAFINQGGCSGFPLRLNCP